ncbi:MAG: hypothetical protein E5V33_10840 [Mesorhizobium sp.]|nr:MAG: hypothetical protein E5V33_10840 [Mesorhizobium sp.]
MAEADKQHLQAMMETADPVLLFAGIRAAQEELGRRVDRRGLNAEIEEPLVVDLQPERGRFLVPQIGCCIHIPVRRQFSSPILVSRCEVLFWTSKAFWKSESGFPRGAPFLSIKLPQPMTRRFHQTRQP